VNAPVVTGRRLLLRPFRREDITETYLSWLNDPDRMRYSRHQGSRHDAASSLEYLASFDGTPSYFWAIEERGASRLLGTMTVHFEGETADVGVLVGPRGEGIGGEAWGLALGHLFRVENRARVTAGTAAAHLAMRRIFERWGMVLEQTLPETGPGGISMEAVRYGVTRDAWMVKSPDADR
jgi:RimJ/RimL family protein N-acetyltransferase